MQTGDMAKEKALFFFALQEQGKEKIPFTVV